jgi:hypothetical protein
MFAFRSLYISGRLSLRIPAVRHREENFVCGYRLGTNVSQLE